MPRLESTRHSTCLMESLQGPHPCLGIAVPLSEFYEYV
jgi:hypothetical protein